MHKGSQSGCQTGFKQGMGGLHRFWAYRNEKTFQNRGVGIFGDGTSLIDFQSVEGFGTAFGPYWAKLN
jgi:hypothetical protein